MSRRRTTSQRRTPGEHGWPPTRTPTREHFRLRAHVLRRDHHACTLCGSREGVSVDHIVPTSQGGRDELANMRTLCRAHHEEKSKREAQAGTQRRRARGKRAPEPHPLDRRDVDASHTNTK